MQQISNQMVIDGVSDSFMSAEDINEWLSIYRDNVGDDDLTTDELLLEFNLFMPYVALGFTQFTKNDSLGTKDIHPFQKKLWNRIAEIQMLIWNFLSVNTKNCNGYTISPNQSIVKISQTENQINAMNVKEY